MAVLKDQYKIINKVKEDNFGILYNGVILSNGLQISIREYALEFSNVSMIEELQAATFKIASLNHPNIVKIIDSHIGPDQRFYIIYDTPYESSLADILGKIEKFGPKETTDILTAVGKALEYAHHKRIFHGTLSPDNIIMLNDGHIKVKNFYIDDLLNSLTVTKGKIISDPIYISPEQLQGFQTTKTSDVYALGALTYKLTSGKNPFPDIINIPMILKNIIKRPTKPTILDPNYPKYIEDICFKAMEREGYLRHQTVLEFLGDLRAKKVTMRVAELKRRYLARQEPPPTVADNKDIQSSQNNAKIPPLFSENNEKEELMAKDNKERSPETSPIFEELGESQKPSKKRNLGKIILIALFAGVIIAIFQSLFIGYFTSVPTVEIPSINGLPLDEAVLLLEERGLRYKISGYSYNPAIPANSIISTTPEMTRIVKKFRIIKLFVSKGISQSVVPTLVNRNLTHAQNIAENKGFKLFINESTYSNKHQRHQVIAQNPEPGNTLDTGATINVEISLGYPVVLNLKDHNDRNSYVKVTLLNPEDWEQQHVSLFVVNNNHRSKNIDQILTPGQELNKEIMIDNSAVIEVYYYNELALKQSAKDLIAAYKAAQRMKKQ